MHAATRRCKPTGCVLQNSRRKLVAFHSIVLLHYSTNAEQPLNILWHLQTWYIWSLMPADLIPNLMFWTSASILCHDVKRPEGLHITPYVLSVIISHHCHHPFRPQTAGPDAIFSPSCPSPTSASSLLHYITTLQQSKPLLLLLKILSWAGKTESFHRNCLRRLLWVHHGRHGRKHWKTCTCAHKQWPNAPLHKGSEQQISCRAQNGG